MQGAPMGDKHDRSKFSLDLQREKRKTPPSFLPELSTVSGVVTPLGQHLTPCVLTAQDMQKIGVATPDMEKLLFTVGLASAPTATQIVSGNKPLTSDKEDFCKELLQNMEANIKIKGEVPTTTLPLSEQAGSSSALTNIQVSTASTIELLRSLNSIKTVKLPLNGNTPTIILPNTNLTSGNISNLIAANSSNHSSLPSVLKTVSGFKLTNSELNNPVHSAFGSPYPVAIVNPQPHISVEKKPEENSSIAAATMLFGSAPKLRVREAETNVVSMGQAGSSKIPSVTNMSKFTNEEDNSDYSLDDEDEIDDDGSMPIQIKVAGVCKSDGSSSSAINFEDQESMKKERKRMRNRIAATKCRQKKIAKINAFEEQIKQLKRKHEELLKEKASLKEKTSLLKENVLFHVKKGCNVIVAPLALTE